MNFIKKVNNGLEYYTCPEMAEAGFQNVFTTKSGGVSFGKNELNFGTSCGDSEENILKNYEKVFEIMDTVPQKVVKSKQTHSDIVLNVTEEFGGEGIIKEQRFFEADGLMTSDPGLTLLVFYADCVPVLIADKSSKTACAVHSGWRGTEANIVGNAVLKILERNNSSPDSLIAAIGPAIGICHFEVQENIYTEFLNKYGKEYVKNQAGKYYIDLAKIVQYQLIKAGIPKENIALADICTYCDKSLYSYRREGNEAGRMAAFIKTPT